MVPERAFQNLQILKFVNFVFWNINISGSMSKQLEIISGTDLLESQQLIFRPKKGFFGAMQNSKI